MVDRLNGLLKADDDQRTNGDCGDMDEEVASGMHRLTGDVNIKHRRRDFGICTWFGLCRHRGVRTVGASGRILRVRLVGQSKVPGEFQASLP